MADERIDQDQVDKEQFEFMGSIKPWTEGDMQTVLAYYADYGPIPAGRSGARVMFEPKGRQIVLEIKVGDKRLVVAQSLKAFISKITHVAIEDIWQDCGLILP